MISPTRPHPWAISLREARATQERLRELVVLEPAITPGDIRSVAGIDNAYVKLAGGYVAYAAAVVFTFPGLEPIETAIGEAPVTFPYVPGFLTFREGPAILDALAKLTGEPDVLLFDGQGYAHPRRMGLATHLGVVLDRPTIGCAKSRLVGSFEEPLDIPGAVRPLLDGGEVIGAAVRTRPGHAPLFVSPGNHLDVDSAVRIVLACRSDDDVMPVPTRAAHDAVTRHTAPLRTRRRPSGA